MKYDSLYEKYSNDVMTDNTQIPKYEQCKDCVHSKSGMRGTPDYKKGSCAKYPYDKPPYRKPNGVWNGTVQCPHRKEEKT